MNAVRLLASPAVWLALALAALTVIGAQVLITPACLGISERDRTAYDERPLWQTHFDALSAVAGCGLLLYDLRFCLNRQEISQVVHHLFDLFQSFRSNSW